MPDAVVVLHPHPAMGGDSQHPFVVTVGALLRHAGFEVATPDFTDPDVAKSASVLQLLTNALDGDRVFYVGYSWGSVVCSHATPARLTGRVLVAPPGLMPLGDLSSLPTLALLPENDQYGGALLPPSVETETILRADHFLWGFVDEFAQRCVEWLTAR